MDFGGILERSWNIIWNNKWLVLLGVLVALGSGSGFNPSNSISDLGDSSNQQQDFEDFFDEGFPSDFDFDDESLEQILPIAGVGVALLITLACVFMIIGLAFWVAGTIARGGLVAGVNAIDGGGVSSFSQAWRAGWASGWRLVGISLVPAVPVLLMVIVLVALIVPMASVVDGGPASNAAIGGLVVTLIAIICTFGLMSLILDLLRVFAVRACMLEGLSVIDAFSRGWEVLRNNIGPALVLFVIRIAIGIGLSIALFVPSIFIALCCFLWPLLWVIQGTISTYFSTMWTLAWRDWTGVSGSGSIEQAPDPAPAV